MNNFFWSETWFNMFCILISDFGLRLKFKTLVVSAKDRVTRCPGVLTEPLLHWLLILLLLLSPTNVSMQITPSIYLTRSVPSSAWTMIPVLGSQPVGDVRHKPGSRLPLLSARPAVTLTTLKTAATNFAAWWTEAQWVWTVCLRLLPDSVTTAIWTRALLRLSPAR